jgi:hypothetical protein
MPGLTGRFFCFWVIGGDWRKVPFDDQHRRSFKMATTAAILDLVSVDYLTNPWVDWSNFFGFIGGDWRKVPVNGQHLRSFKILDLVSVRATHYNIEDML